MLDEEFKAFSKIENIKHFNARMIITQKINGTNAQIFIKKLDENSYLVKAGSRNRWLTIDNDNYGFCTWVEENREELIRFFGEGRWYGEWAGKGIAAGEGLSEKHFVMFDWWHRRDMPKETTARILLTPILYDGKFDLEKIDYTMQSLKETGSRLAEFDKPEGIVINFNGEKYKKVFSQEEVAWKPKKEPTPFIENADIIHLLQPARMEKIKLSDERFNREYPKSLGEIVKTYINDLIAENQIIGSEDEVIVIKKTLSRQVFSLAKEIFEQT